MTLAESRHTNVPRPTSKDPKDTPDRAFNRLAWGNHYGTEGVSGIRYPTIRYQVLYEVPWYSEYDMYCESVYYYVGNSIPLCTCNLHEDRCVSREEQIHIAYSASTNSIR